VNLKWGWGGVQTDIKEWHGSMDREITYLTTKENYRDGGIQSFG